MINFLILSVIIFFFCFFSWRWWGKSLAEYLSSPPGSSEKRRDVVMRKLESLKQMEKDLKADEDEIKVSKMLESVQKEKLAKEKELEKINKKLKK